jgi:hypothetical protein
MAYHNHFMLNSLGVNPKSAMPSFPLSFPFRAEETADRDMQLDGSAEARQVGESTSVSAMDATGIKGAERASGRQCGGRKDDGQALTVEHRLVEAASRRSIEQIKRDQTKLQEYDSWMNLTR